MVRFRTRITVADGRFRLHLGRRYIRLESLRVKICYVKRWRCTGPGRVCLKLPKAPLRVWRRLNAFRGVTLWLIDERGHVMGCICSDVNGASTAAISAGQVLSLGSSHFSLQRVKDHGHTVVNASQQGIRYGGYDRKTVAHLALNIAPHIP